MNRRKFIKGFAPMVALPLIINVSEEEEEAVTITNTTPPPEILYGPYIVYFYERKQGEWIFSQNIKDSFSCKEFNNSSKSYSYVGYMRDGKVHFQSLDNAIDFIRLDQKGQSSDNLEDLIYDVYYKNPKHEDSVELQVAHYWFNKNTSSTIHWSTQDKTNTSTNYKDNEKPFVGALPYSMIKDGRDNQS